MAVYKVPQDVEADDKLLGPFSFRQFIYLIIVAMAIGIAWLLSHIFIGLIIIPAPIIILFGVLALPLKKDQPMETYLSAMVSFYFLKPRKRLWTPDGLNSLVEITAPREVEPERAKDITRNEARERLGYLTDIVESRGWAVRGVGVPAQGIEAPQASEDMLDDSNSAAQRFDTLLESKKEESRQAITQNLHQQAAIAPPQPPQATSTSFEQRATSPQQTPSPTPSFNPYPETMRQTVIEPITTTDSPAIETPQSTSGTPPSPAIIELATNSGDLTVATVAEQAHRIEKRERGLPEGEVEISLH